MRIEIPISPDEPIGYYPKDIHLSLTIEDARKLAAIRSGLRDANFKHSGNCICSIIFLPTSCNNSHNWFMGLEIIHNFIHNLLAIYHNN